MVAIYSAETSVSIYGVITQIAMSHSSAAMATQLVQHGAETCASRSQV
jgi:hypothetical protein